jgi:hypothetical protein
MPEIGSIMITNKCLRQQQVTKQHKAINIATKLIQQKVR